MFEKKFLAYVLYITLLEIREKAHVNNDARVYHLCDMLHNVPFSLLNDESAKQEYNKMLESVESLNIPDWIEIRMKEFKDRYPELFSPNSDANIV